jgi:spectrin beta
VLILRRLHFYILISLQNGQRLISGKNYRSDDVKKIMDDLNLAWDKLVAMSADKGRRLRQASAQHTYNR